MNCQRLFFLKKPKETKREIIRIVAAALLLCRNGIDARIVLCGDENRCTPDTAYYLAEAKKEGVPVTFSSDAHSAQFLDFAFDRAKDAAIKAGYAEAAFLEDGQIKFVKLD